MKTIGVNTLTLAILAALFTASLAIAASDDGTVRGQPSQRNREAVRSEAVMAPAGRSLSVPPSARTGHGPRTIELFAVADGSVRVLIMFQETDHYTAMPGTTTAGIPYDIWCMIHFCKRWG